MNSFGLSDGIVQSITGLLKRYPQVECGVIYGAWLRDVGQQAVGRNNDKHKDRSTLPL